MKPHPLKVERELRGWSQARVAEALGVSTHTVIRWEQRRVIPYPYYREQLAQLFGKSVQELDLLPPEQQPGSQLALPQEPAAAFAAASPPNVSPPPPLLLDPASPRLMGRTGSLVGRAALLAQIKARLFAGQSLALTALDGLPGVGKTTLAVAVSLDPEVQAHFAGGILWAGLGPQPDRLGELSRWGALLGVRAAESADPPSSCSCGGSCRARLCVHRPSSCTDGGVSSGAFSGRR
jgi:transcriptional regulator with XRE-family HTH domain